MTPKTPPQRFEGGMWCADVLALLPDFVEGELGPAALAQVHAHLGACDWCTRFGGSYAATVAALRAAPIPSVAPTAPTADLADRLLKRLGR